MGDAQAEFGTQDVGDALGALAQAAAATQQADSPVAAVPAAQPAPAEQPGVLPAEQVVVEIDPKQVAASSIQPGCAHDKWKDVRGWLPLHERPQLKHLINAMSDRQLSPGEKEPQPRAWPLQRAANWLHTHPPKGLPTLATTTLGAMPGGPLALPAAAGLSPVVAPGPASGGGGGKKAGGHPPPGSDRFTDRSQGVRMITLIAKDPDLREGFLVKDAKFETRNEKDIADRDSCARSDHRTTACVAGVHPFAFDGAKCSMHVCLSLDYPRLCLQRCEQGGVHFCGEVAGAS